jgi:hypothetical protein
MRVLEQYIDEVGQIMKNANVTVVPQQIANVKTFFEGLGAVTEHMSVQTSAEVLPAPPPMGSRAREIRRQS